MTEQNLPFHPNPSVPKLRLPDGACDAHCHVFGPAKDFPFAPERTYTPVDAPWETLAALHSRLGISRTVLVQASCHGTDNAAMLDAIAKSNGSCRGVAMVRRDISDAELDRLHAGGVRGIRFNFVSHLGKDADVDAVRDLAQRISRLGWHAVVHFDADRLETLAPVLKSLPVPMVIDHMGRVDASKGIHQPAYEMLVDLLRDDRFWVKVCGAERITREGPPYADAVPIAADLVARFTDQVLWGTDWPHPNIRKDMPDDGALVDLLADIAPGQTLLEKLTVTNPTRLYWQN
ncbi:amidohydrolase family protein [Roseinatronobacter alkalisoli]|uniref:Amidohydrolase family protein n=1 Tax=Roseinatronobacter alkalisoli TaxID=3028235 RepID=A0ABT5T5Z7_9RHOB|nr:amidohydrolase family protein [Roseinatronobacter sp. HJB301]MDD7969662.1 amidohydrolase family protein [Roseinatronobacter sp. HJB301]